jgi:hypothetical protein
MSNTKTNPQTICNGPKQTQFRIKFKANNIKKKHHNKKSSSFKSQCMAKTLPFFSLEAFPKLHTPN